MKSTRYALVLAGTYLAVGSGYILLSGQIASWWSASVADLAWLERVKGLVFVATTTLLLFGLSRTLLARIERYRADLSSARQAILAADHRVMAGRLASGLAHDLSNVITVMAAGVDELLPAASPAHRTLLEDMKASAHRGRELALQVSRVNRAGPLTSRSSQDLVSHVEQAFRLLQLHSKAKRVRLRMEADGPVRVVTNATLVYQIVTNLVLNAADATRDGGEVEVRVVAAPGAAQIEVHDDGPGVPPQVRERLFTPFLTTKESGSGLGLVSVKACAELHGGQVEVARSPLGGACFRVSLPRADRDAGAADAARVPTSTVFGGRLERSA